MMPRGNQQLQKNLIQKVVGCKGKLNMLFDKQPLIFSQIVKVFGINETRQNIEALYKLKQRLINIVLQQKQEFLEYLSLPKFRQISQHAIQLLKQALQEISELINNQRQLTHFTSVVDKISSFIPKISTLQQIEDYHLNIFYLYSTSYLCPTSIETIENDRRNLYLSQNSAFNFKPQIFHNFSHFDFVKSQEQQHQRSKKPYETIQMQEQKNNIFKNFENSDSNFNQMSKKIPSAQKILNDFPLISQKSLSKRQLKIFHSHANLTLDHQRSNTQIINNAHKSSKRYASQLIGDYSPQNIKKQKVSEYFRYIEDYSQPLSNASQHKHKIVDVLDPNFKNCVCKGKIQKAGACYFLCNQCMCKFHYQCLKKDAIKDQRTHRKCPICTVQEVNNILVKLKKPALLHEWINCNKNNPKAKSIKLSSQLLNRMKQLMITSESKFYLKLIIITKSLDLKGNKENKNNQKQMKIPVYVQSSDEQAQNKEQSQMQHEENELQNRIQKVNAQKFFNQANKNFQVSETRSSIDISQKIIEGLLKLRQPLLSLNFALSSNNTDGENIKQQQKLIYYGIYELKRRSIEQVIKRVVDVQQRNNKGKNIGSSQNQKKIKQLLKQYLKKGHKIEDQNWETKQVIITLKLKQKNQEQLVYPVRYSKCKRIDHVFQLKDFLQKIYSKDNHYQKVHFSPDLNTVQCPLCVKQGIDKNGENNQQLRNGQIYLDGMLFQTINNNLNKQKKQWMYQQDIQQRRDRCMCIDIAVQFEYNSRKEEKEQWNEEGKEDKEELEQRKFQKEDDEMTEFSYRIERIRMETQNKQTNFEQNEKNRIQQYDENQKREDQQENENIENTVHNENNVHNENRIEEEDEYNQQQAHKQDYMKFENRLGLDEQKDENEGKQNQQEGGGKEIDEGGEVKRKQVEVQIEENVEKKIEEKIEVQKEENRQIDGMEQENGMEVMQGQNEEQNFG